jgi:DNA-binding beta-propeller fold protein YncE
MIDKEIKMRIKSIYIIIIITIGALSSCMDEDLFPITPYNLYGSRGVFVLNEGNYLNGDGSLSYYDLDTHETINQIFSKANGIPLGDVAYSMTIYNGKGYIVVNNSGLINVVDANTLLLLGKIEGLPSPRHMLILNDELALVSDLYARAISIVNPKSMQVIGSIKTGGTSLPYYQHSTENLIKIGNKIYTNCWSFDHKVLVIDAETLKLTDSINVGIQPLSMVKDKNNSLWVINDGGYAGNPIGQEKPSLMRINTNTNQVALTLSFPSLTDNVGQIATNLTGDSLYFICNHVYKMHINDTVLPSSPIIVKGNRNFRALGIDPITGDIYVADAKDFMAEGTVFRYKSNGEAIHSFDVGIIPGNFCFN